MKITIERVAKIMEIEEYLFPNDSYDTPKECKRSWRDKIFLNSRIYFYWCNFKTFVQTGIIGVKGQLDAKAQTRLSNRNIKLIEACGGKIHIRGLNNIDNRATDSVVLIGNHMSLLETAVFHAILRSRIDFTFVIKESLLNVRYFGDIMRSLGAIPVSRKNPKEDFKQVITLGKKTLASGKSVLLFPQSTRSSKFNPEQFNSIGVKLAKSANVQIIPFALKTDFIQNGRFLRDMGPLDRSQEVWFEFGKPMNVQGSGKEELQATIDFIEDRLSKWNKGE